MFKFEREDVSKFGGVDYSAKGGSKASTGAKATMAVVTIILSIAGPWIASVRLSIASVRLSIAGLWIAEGFWVADCWTLDCKILFDCWMLDSGLLDSGF